VRVAAAKPKATIAPFRVLDIFKAFQIADNGMHGAYVSLGERVSVREEETADLR